MFIIDVGEGARKNNRWKKKTLRKKIQFHEEFQLTISKKKKKKRHGRAENPS